jgi:hypothetical protein
MGNPPKVSLIFIRDAGRRRKVALVVSWHFDLQCVLALADGLRFPSAQVHDESKSFGDAALAWKWHKRLSARLRPVKDKGAGDRTEFESQYFVQYDPTS